MKNTPDNFLTETHRAALSPHATDLTRKTFDRTYEVLKNAFATPTAIGRGSISGCLYRRDGTKVSASERFCGYRGDRVRNSNPEHTRFPDNAFYLGGRGVYLGHLMSGHYGHFIVETLSTFWLFEEIDARAFDYFLFHPFIFGSSIPEYAKIVFQRMQVDVERVKVVGTEPILMKEIVVPERLVRLNHSADRSLRRIYNRIANVTGDSETPSRRVYISRRKLTAKSWNRVVANEVAIEAVFKRFGFEILYPEKTPFKEQLKTYRDTAILAGPSGSGLHNSLFTREGTLVVELGDPRYKGEPAPTQKLCNYIAGSTTHFIPFRGIRFGPKKTMLFDLRHITAQLELVIVYAAQAPTFKFPGGSCSGGRYLRWNGLFEVAFRTARPALGYLARRLATLLRGRS